MLLAAQLFTEELENKEVHFDAREVSGEVSIISVPYDGKMNNFIFNGPDGRYVSMVTHFESVPEDKVSDMLVLCNQLNSTYKWLKFYIDNDNDLMVEDDAIVSADETAADECFELLIHRAHILKEVKPAIMRVIYF